MVRKRGVLSFSFAVVVTLLVSLITVGIQPVAAATPTELFFSEYIEGSSNNKALEIYNGTGAAINLASAGYSVQMFFNGSAASGLTINLTGSIAAGDVYVLAQSTASAAILDQADQTSPANWYNGDDAITLRKGTTVIDSIGQTGFDPGTEWGTGLTSTADNTIRRKSTVSAGDTNTGDVFDPSVEWDGFAVDSFSDLGSYGVTPPPTSTPTTTPPNTCDDPFTPIYTIQGTTDTNTANGQIVTTEGVVIADVQGANGQNGFYIQDPQGDGNAQTSDGVFVFVPSANSAWFNFDVAAGDAVQVSGRATEFQGLTEIDTVTSIAKCGTPTTIAPTPVQLPETTNGDLERYEGMLITINQTLTVDQNFFQGRYGQVTLSTGGRLYNPTNVYDAGSAAAIALANENARRLIVLDDAKSLQNPNPIPYIGADNTLRAGDTTPGLTGVLDFGPINSDSNIRDYRVQPTQPVSFTRVNQRTAAPAAVGGNAKVASFNVLNYFNGNGQGGGFPTSRGANTTAEFQRQRDKEIAALVAMDADVVGLMEMENDGNGQFSAVQDLVNGLNAATAAGTYATTAIPTGDPNADVQLLGTDEIRVALIYKPGRVTPVGAPLTSGDTIFSRPPLAQTFQLNSNGELFSVVVNHFKSKGSCPTSASDPNADKGDGQGCWNQQRVQQAQALISFINTSVIPATGDSDVLIIGDLNAYGQEDPIQTLTAGGFINEIARFIGDDAYSYVFDGQSGYLDHALASSSLDAQVSGVTEWHINADEPSVIDYNTEFKPQDLYSPTPYRSSDHDPVIIGLELVKTNKAPVANAQQVTTTEDADANITLVATDADNDALSYSIVSQPTNGTLSGNGANLIYSPKANFNGTDSFKFKANDGTADSNIATVSITVSAVNDAPVAVNQSVTIAEDVAQTITLSASDVDNPSLSYSIVAQPAHGTLSGSGTNLTYTPDANFNGADSFSFKANDGELDSNVATVSITVSAVNDAPVADAQEASTNKNVPVEIRLTGSDVDGDPLTYVIVGQPANGTLSGSGANLTYTPKTNFSGPDSFTFRTNDGTIDSNVATVSINVAFTNDAPVANAQTVTTAEDTAKSITLTATDADGDALTYTIVGQPAHGTLSGTAPNVTYTPNADYNGTDSFTFKANDTLDDSNVAIVSINVTPVNDKPVATGQSATTDEDTPKAITLTANDLDGDRLAYTYTAPTHGKLTGTAPNLTYTPDPNFNGPDSFTFKVNDGTTDSNTVTVTITVTPVNDNPVAKADLTTVRTGKSVTITVLSNDTDADGDKLRVLSVRAPQHGTVSFNAVGSVIYTPAKKYIGTDAFEYVVTDDHGGTAIGTVTVTITK